MFAQPAYHGTHLCSDWLMDDSTQCLLVIFFTCEKAILEADWTYRFFHRVKCKEERILFGRFITWNWHYIYIIIKNSAVNNRLLQAPGNKPHKHYFNPRSLVTRSIVYSWISNIEIGLFTRHGQKFFWCTTWHTHAAALPYLSLSIVPGDSRWRYTRQASEYFSFMPSLRWLNRHSEPLPLWSFKAALK